MMNGYQFSSLDMEILTGRRWMIRVYGDRRFVTTWVDMRSLPRERL